MRLPILVLPLLLWSSYPYAQNSEGLIERIYKAQKELHTVSYAINRIDTFTSGEVWNHKGRCEIDLRDPDSVLGFRFWAKRNDYNGETLYDGKVAYAVEHKNKSYDAITKKENIYHILGSPGGQMVFSNLVRLDTSRVSSTDIWEEPSRYVLRFNYPDNEQYSIKERFKILYIDKKTFLPTEAIDHLTALGKKQSHHYRIELLRLNENSFVAPVAKAAFLSAYTQEIRQPNAALQSMIGTIMPSFELAGFNGETVRSSSLKGKAVLLDFWAVWCGPCVASMPKVEELYQKYKDKGLIVYGVLNEKGDQEPATLLVKKNRYTFPMLIGNDKLNKDYNVSAIPLYVLIDQQGKIVFVSEGYSTNLEQAIQNTL